MITKNGFVPLKDTFYYFKNMRTRRNRTTLDPKTV